MRREIVDTLYDELNATNKFKQSYKNVIPAVAIVKRHPAFAVAVDTETRSKSDLAGCRFENELTLIVMLYQQNRSHDFEDRISDLIDVVEDVVKNSQKLNDMVIDIWVSKITQDGGILHPNYVAEIEVKAIYRRKD